MYQEKRSTGGADPQCFREAGEGGLRRGENVEKLHVYAPYKRYRE